MHFEILVEDKSGKIALEFILEKILGPNGQEHTYRIFPYNGILAGIEISLRYNSTTKFEAHDNLCKA